MCFVLLFWKSEHPNYEKREFKINRKRQVMKSMGDEVGKVVRIKYVGPVLQNYDDFEEDMIKHSMDE